MGSIFVKRGELAIHVLYLLAALIAVLIVPWVVSHGNLTSQFFHTTREYGFLLSPPGRDSKIDYGAVLLELMAIGILAGTTFLLREQLGKWGLVNGIEKLLSRSYWMEEKIKWGLGWEDTRLKKWAILFAISVIVLTLRLFLQLR